MTKKTNNTRKPNRRANKSKYDPKETNKTVSEEGQIGKYNNDPSWYFDDRLLADQVSSFSFNQFLGHKDTFKGSKYLGELDVPSILRIRLNPSPGYSEPGRENRAGINRAGLKTFTRLSAGNAKTTNYAPQDVSTLILALGEIISISEHCRRAFGLAFTYNKRNWAYPRQIIRAAGFDADDLLDNLAPYRMRFNSVINIANQISFPSNINYFDKCANLYSRVYLDSQSPMAQSYILTPQSTWIVDETAYDQGTILKQIGTGPDEHGVFHHSTFPGKMTMGQYIDILEDMIYAILQSATFNYIYSDVLRLFGEGGQLLTIPFVDESYMVMPEYDPMMVLQINNSIAVPEPSGAALGQGVTPYNDVYPSVDENCLIYAPYVSTNGTRNSAYLAADAIINFPHSMGNPDVSQRIESTRFTAIAREADIADDAIHFTGLALPDHYVVNYALFYNDYEDGIAIFYHNAVTTEIETSDSVMTTDELKGLSLLSQFDYAPRMYITTSGAPETMRYIFGDLDYFTQIDYAYLNKVNELIYVNLFDLR